jgi:UDP-galactopyranose mutase
MPDVHFVGRLATYRYYNMDQIVAQSLTQYGKIIGKKRSEATVVTMDKKIVVPQTLIAANGKTGHSNGKTVSTQ